MATCTGDKFVQTIERTECIGNSLTKINSNFAALDTAVCELEQSVGVLTYTNSLTSVIGTSPISVSNNNTISISNATTNSAGAMSAADKAKLDGLSQGIPLADFTGTNQLLATNGYQKLPGGLIMQWGKVTTTSGGRQTITFSIPFPNLVLNVQLTKNNLQEPTDSNGDGDIPVIAGTITNTGFTISVENGNETHWTALGY